MVRMKYLLSILLVLLFVAGCAPIVAPASGPQSAPSAPATPPVDTESGDVRGDVPDNIIVPSSPAAERAPNSAVAQLVADAWGYNRAGEYDRSNAVVERALRINHTEPEIYLVMASNYFAMAQLQLAEQLVRQGLPLAGGNSAIKRELQRLLSQIISAK
jgi:tetratricopeptide (TPR) repeat protein